MSEHRERVHLFADLEQFVRSIARVQLLMGGAVMVWVAGKGETASVIALAAILIWGELYEIRRVMEARQILELEDRIIAETARLKRATA